MSVRLCLLLCVATVFAASKLPANFENYARVLALQSPAGSYTGSKSVMGKSVTMTCKFVSSTTLSLVASGTQNINCPSEPYTISGSAITLTNANKEGDCVHEALEASGAKIVSITYSSSTDSIVVQMQYPLMKVSIVLKHVSAYEASHLEPVYAPVDDIKFVDYIKQYYAAYAQNEPNGTYTGKVTVVGATVYGQLDMDSKNSTFDMYVTGIITLTCMAEPYTYSNGVITVPNMNKDGDCIHDTLEQYDAELQYINYDATSDEITVGIKVAGLKIVMVLKHVSQRELLLA